MPINPTIAQYPKVDRIEVIDNTGRAFTVRVEPGAETHLQDEGRTLKVFAGKRTSKES